MAKKICPIAVNHPKETEVKNVGTSLLAALALSVCCGGPLILSSLSLASLGWITSDVALASFALAAGIVLTILWYRKRRKQQCQCEDGE